MPIHHSPRLSSLSNCSAFSPLRAGGRPVGVACSPHWDGVVEDLLDEVEEEAQEGALSVAVAVPMM